VENIERRKVETIPTSHSRYSAATSKCCVIKLYCACGAAGDIFRLVEISLYATRRDVNKTAYNTLPSC